MCVTSHQILVSKYVFLGFFLGLPRVCKERPLRVQHAGLVEGIEDRRRGRSIHLGNPGAEKGRRERLRLDDYLLRVHFLQAKKQGFRVLPDRVLLGFRRDRLRFDDYLLRVHFLQAKKIGFY